MRNAKEMLRRLALEVARIVLRLSRASDRYHGLEDVC